MSESSTREITELELAEKTRQLQAITEAMTVFLDRGDWGEASSRLLDGAFAQCGAQYGFVGVLLEGGVFRVLAHAGIVWDVTRNRSFYEEALAHYESVGYLDFASLDNLFGRVLTSGEALIENAPQASPFSRGLPEGHPPLESFLGVPFSWGDNVVGMIGVANRPTGFKSRERLLLEGLANTAGVLYDSYLRGQKEIVQEAERRRAETALQVTNRKLELALEELRATQDRIVRQERLHALGLMAGGIAHDFNNALQPILGFSELLLAHPEILHDRERADRYLRVLNTGAKDARAVIRRLGDFHHHREGERSFELADLNSIVEQVILLTRPLWRDEAMAAGVTVHVVRELGDVQPWRLDAAEIREALTNLVCNALEAMPEGGELTLGTREDAGEVSVEIRDTGIGMSPSVRDRCSEPFFTTKGDQGSGIGLWMVHWIAERHAGRLEVSSSPGSGSSFRLVIPAGVEDGSAGANAGQEAVADNVRAPAAGEAAPPAAAIRILLVDDDPRIWGVLEAYLAEDGYLVETVTDPRQALAKFRGEEFDLVITDYSMPGKTGLELAQELREVDATLPLILLTGVQGLHAMPRGEESLFSHVLKKPIALEDLRLAVEDAVAGR